MPVTNNTGTVLPVTGVETVVATIAGGPFDKVSVFFQGGRFGGGGPLGLRLYATVGGLLTRIAERRLMGDIDSSIVDWQTPNSGASETEEVNAGGTNYTVTVIDLSNGLPPPGTAPREAVTCTIAGVNEFDTAPSANQSALLTLAPGAIGLLPIFAGFAQQMDVAIGQSNLPPVTVRVLASNGAGSVIAPVDSASGGGTGPVLIGPVFRQLQLPVATQYVVEITNDSNQTVTVPLTACTYSTAVTAGGAVVLGGDVIGPSNANTVIKWDNVALTLAGIGSFGAPADAAIPIFDINTLAWRALPLGQDIIVDDGGLVTVGAWLHQPLDPATMGAPANGDIPVWDGVGFVWKAEAGTSIGPMGPDVIGTIGANEVVQWVHKPLDPVTMGAPNLGDVPSWNGVQWVAGPVAAAIVLTGNVNGPANANRFLSLNLSSVDADFTFLAVDTEGWFTLRMRGLTANRTVNLPAAPTDGEVVVVKDGDGSLAAFNIIINGGANPIDEVAGPYTMTAVQNGVKGAVSLVFYAASAAGPAGWYLF